MYHNIFGSQNFDIKYICTWTFWLSIDNIFNLILSFALPARSFSLISFGKDKDYKTYCDDIRKIIKLIAHELTLTNKKELKVKLFEGLENPETFEIWNGRTRSKGYIYISIYHKMRKRQYGNRWMTQFVPLCREEVRSIEERGKLEAVRMKENSVQEYITQVENSSLDTDRTH